MTNYTCFTPVKILDSRTHEATITEFHKQLKTKTLKGLLSTIIITQELRVYVK